ncbi:hypothetical protein BU24DRAFT_476374 [Aaosphaeria arxii CBS 175.79]|uniref:Uncharacterized protein n=1 Tax=Aaosphaeria arxii CBS 175.79 TaxID=1450172 RepID=A0A6A5Y280_9PLEO|nr:uncharacterized protein BU24DRAFT_476374 [Aaosphaeria arxii CBS 175.79]KAF2019366.1 hypothetical protein BU24DRAFT_476374 [Aaosphaeria arxii CBS 175.79]
MYSRKIILAALFGLVTAAPKPQRINISALKELSTPSVLGPDLAAISATASSYDPSKAASAAAAAIATDPVTVQKRTVDIHYAKRAACEREPGGTGPIPGDGTVNDYLAIDGPLARAALNAPTPSGYTKSFTNLHGSTQQIGYLTFFTMPGTDYDVEGCAARCNSDSYCYAFNIYYERDPAVDPSIDCPNPAPATNIKCSLYGYPVTAGTATNTGQYRGPPDANGQAFHVVIAGSNGYTKLTATPVPDPLANFTGPSELLRGAIDAPLDNGVDTYLGMRLYNDGPYDPTQCAAICEAQNAYNRATANNATGTYKPCNFFNSYILVKNEVPQGTYCGFYTRTWGNEYADNVGYQDGEDVYTIEESYTFFRTVPDSGRL